MSDLFEAASLSDGAPKPLAERLRPDRLEDVVGQDHLLDSLAPIGRMVAQGRISSMILWGPPGTGKTTIARLLANLGGHHFEQLSAVFSGVADLRRVFDAARVRRQDGQGTVLFVDEIHRFNKSQQDGFLPFMEDGTVILIGATTENPSFELNAPLLSRAQVLVLKRLDDQGIDVLFRRAEDATGAKLPLTGEARTALAAMADGDGRYALNLAEELLAVASDTPLDTKAMAKAIQHRAPVYDKAAEGHYNLISALHKSVRGSDVDAALYWLARMLAGGEDPLFLARRVVRMAVEDIGLADPNALVQAIAAKDAFDFLGSPEGELAIAQAVMYLATAPKSNAVYRAFGKATSDAAETGSLAPPARALNAPTRLMKELGYGAGYHYDHDAKDGFAGDNYFPDDMERRAYYQPTDRGQEKQIAQRLAAWAQIRTPSETP
jgi:putative ATPase